MSSPIPLSKILQAQNNTKPIVYKTPLYYSKSLSEMFDKTIYLKLECFQPINVFKIRGAYNKIIHLLDNNPNLLLIRKHNFLLKKRKMELLLLLLAIMVLLYHM